MMSPRSTISAHLGGTDCDHAPSLGLNRKCLSFPFFQALNECVTISFRSTVFWTTFTPPATCSASWTYEAGIVSVANGELEIFLLKPRPALEVCVRQQAAFNVSDNLEAEQRLKEKTKLHCARANSDPLPI
jgi:hypothetical protein